MAKQRGILGELSVLVTAPLTDIRRQLNAIRGMAAAAGRDAGSAFSGAMKGAIGVAAGNLLADAVRSAVSGMKALVNEGIDFNAQMERLQVGFSVLIGSEIRAKNLLKDIRNYANVTPFETEELATVATMLLGTKSIMEHEILPTIKKIGDAAAGSTLGFAGMQRITLQISQMLAAGKVTAADMRPIAQAGIPAWSLLAEKMGLSTREVMAMSKAGKLGLKEVKLLIDAIGDKYKGMTEKQSKSFLGLMSTFRDNLKLSLGAITAPFFDNMKRRMEAIVKFMLSADFAAGLKKAVAVAKQLADSMSAVSKFVVGLAKSVSSAFSSSGAKEFWEELAKIKVLFVAIYRDVVDQLGPALKGMSGNTSGMVPALTAALKWFREILDVVQLLTTNFPRAWEIFQTSNALAVSMVMDRFRHLFGEYLPALFKSSAELMAEAFALAIGVIQKSIKRMADTIMDVIAAIQAADSGDFFNATIHTGMAVARATAEPGRVKSDLAGMATQMAGSMAGKAAALPKFGSSPATQELARQLKDLLGAQVGERKRTQNGRAITGFLDKIGGMAKGLAPANLGKMFAEGGEMLAGLPGFRTPADKAEDGEKKKKGDFVGFSEMNKKMQLALFDSERKDRKSLVKAAEKGAKAGEKGAAAGEAVAKGMGALLTAVKSIPFGLAD